MQLHDKADFNDLVLRDQISKIIFLVLPQISVVLIKVCQEETLRGSSLVESAVKAIGRYLCLVFEDYDKTASTITNDDFVSLVHKYEAVKNDASEDNLLQSKNKSRESQAEFIASLKKSTEWVRAASHKLSPALQRLKNLRGSEYQKVRYELAVLSWNILHKCFANIHSLIPFLLENLIVFADDSDEAVRKFSQTSLLKLSELMPAMNQEIAELFTSHLTIMPRIILTGDSSEQISAFTLLNSFVATISGKTSQLNSLLSNPIALEKFLNVMLSSCEIDVPNDLAFHENLTSGSLSDNFYQMKMPWKHFKNLKNEEIVKKFGDICHNIGSSTASQACVNYLLDNLNSIEYLVLIIEILNCGEKLTLEHNQLEGIVEEFLNETYWSMPIQVTSKIERKQRSHEEWHQESTPGLYESAVEIKVRDIALDDDGEKSYETTLKTIKYNILSTCFVLELMATSAKIFKTKFQKFMLRLLFRILEKAGSVNFIISMAGLETLQAISIAMGFSEISELIDANSDFLLFNIQKLLKRSQDNDAIFDMLAAVFKFSKNSMTAYIKDIVETVAEQITSERFSSNTSCYLKLFRLYVVSIKQWEENVNDGKYEVESAKWDEIYDQCLFELNKLPEDVPEDVYETCPLNEENYGKEESKEDDKPEESNTVEVDDNQNEIPAHVELVIKILTSTLQYFASTVPAEVITTHEIFINSFPILARYENQFLQMVHQMWYPFSKQFQGKNLVILQYSFQLLCLTAQLAKDFIHKKSTSDVIPVINKFLVSSCMSTNHAFTQEFKLQHQILGEYGALAVDLDIDEEDLDCIIDILLKYRQHSNESLASASLKSLDVLRILNPGLIHFKMNV